MLSVSGTRIRPDGKRHAPDWTRPLALDDLPAASRLLDDALDLDPGRIEPWFAALPAAQQHLIPMLRDMLAEYLAPQQAGFMQAGPRLDDSAAGEPAARPGDTLGPYRLVREIGCGGMSRVWLAERPDGVVKRAVALKLPLKSATRVERFEHECDVLARLNHPQIACLYDAGVTPAGQPYIVLEYVAGLPITKACDTQAMDVPARLRLFLQLLAAVAHAHKHLVVHGDIKPTNVFVGADGQVKLLDFGIAKLLADPATAAEATALTHEGGCALTPRYAAPEQLNGWPISTATDVYALGALLHELLVGNPPHAGAQGSVAEAMHALMHADAARPSTVPIDIAAAAARGVASADRLHTVLAGDLDTIVLKALRKEPADRYSSVERFAEVLASYLASRPIAARLPHPGAPGAVVRSTPPQHRGGQCRRLRCCHLLPDIPARPAGRAPRCAAGARRRDARIHDGHGGRRRA